ncbi:MAG: AAA family ATPase [Saprospiraceae bacterium]|nr:AAA family ATPase [Saprospiraceae bacterium]
MNQKYPIGIQDFRKLRKEGFVYIDKTRLIHQLVTTGHYYFLSRPRRFGKSLLVSTIKELFSGDKALFQGLWIENNWDWNTKLPVIHLKMSQIDYQSNGLYQGLNQELQRIGTDLGIQLTEETLKNRFSELIQKAAQAGPVVILMDEYDKSIIDNLENPALAEKNQDILKQFYSILKDADPHIRLMLVTGVSKFSKVSIFSDLNNLEDITISAPLHDITGITQEELNRHFSAEIAEIATNNSTSETDLKDTIRQWYNGYSWGGKDRLHNPFSILSFFKNQQFNNFWFETGTPSFLVELIRTAEKFELDKTEYTALLGLSEFDPQNPNFKTVLFQTGYLTIDQINLPEGWCQLKYPNKEVKDSLEHLVVSC